MNEHSMLFDESLPKLKMQYKLNSDFKIKKRRSKLSADLGISIKGDFKVENGVQISDI